MRHFYSIKTFVLFTVTVLTLTVLTSNAWAIDLFVDDTGDDTGNDCKDSGSPCATITHAISQSSDGDTINIAAGTYNESVNIIDLDLTLQGEGSSDTTLDGTGTGDSVIDIFGVVDVTIADVTIQKGEGGDGAGIEIGPAPTVTLNDCIITENKTATSNGGGIYSDGGSLAINRCTISKNESFSGGGGIEMDSGDLTISDSVIRENTTGGDGGGFNLIGTSPSLTLDNSQVIMNTAMSPGGGIAATDATVTITESRISDNDTQSSGGGIFAKSTVLTIEQSLIDINTAKLSGGGLSYITGGTSAEIQNTTFSGNEADNNGGAIVNAGSMKLNHVTIFGNTADAESVGGGGNNFGDGGGIFNDDGGSATTRIKNSIIAGNIDPSSAPDCFGTITSLGFNILGTNENCTFNDTTGDQIGTMAVTIDPDLEDLANNGGPTQTHALKSDSPAVDKGTCTDIDDFDVSEDQRSSERPAGDDCDIGAYELSVCGDDFIGADEECEDGNTIDTDDCTNQCKFNECGDGSVLEDFEECDDGNTNDGDGCDSDCFKENILEDLGGCSLISKHPRTPASSHVNAALILLLVGVGFGWVRKITSL